MVFCAERRDGSNVKMSNTSSNAGMGWKFVYFIIAFFCHIFDIVFHFHDNMPRLRCG